LLIVTAFLIFLLFQELGRKSSDKEIKAKKTEEEYLFDYESPNDRVGFDEGPESREILDDAAIQSDDWLIFGKSLDMLKKAPNWLPTIERIYLPISPPCLTVEDNAELDRLAEDWKADANIQMNTKKSTVVSFSSYGPSDGTSSDGERSAVSVQASPTISLIRDLEEADENAKGSALSHKKKEEEKPIYSISFQMIKEEAEAMRYDV
jgi:hypothetical protein